MKWLVLGASSGIAAAILDQALGVGDEAWLLCRRREALAERLARASAGGPRLRWLPGEALHESHLQELLAAMDRENWRPDRVLLAWGVLLHEPADAARLKAMRRVNGEASLRWLEAVLRVATAGRPPEAPPLRALILGSVAGDRTRPSMRVYGQSKRDLEIGIEALRAELTPTGQGLSLTLAKPGPVRTPMVAGGWLRAIAASPEAVARQLLAALEAGRPTVYAPAWWGTVMALLRRR